MSKSNDTKTALKLVNKYAESYKNLEEANKSLQKEIADLKTTININKGIIRECLTKNNTQDNSPLIKALKEQIDSLTLSKNSILNEKNQLQSKLDYYCQIISEYQYKNKSSSEFLKNKLFVSENLIKKKDSIIENLKKEIENLKNSELGEELITEIIVTEPHKVLNKLYDELSTYKSAYETLAESLKSTKISNAKLEKTAINYQNEISRLKDVVKQHQKEKINLLNSTSANNHQSSRSFITNEMNRSKLSERSKIDQMEPNSPLSLNINLNNPIPFVLGKTNVNKSISSHEYLKKKKNLNFQNEEWIEIIRNLGLSNEELKNFSKNKMVSKLIEAIEMLNKTIEEKNQQIIVLDQENESLNFKNSELNNENMSLINVNNELLSKYNNLSFKYNLMKSSKNSDRGSENSSMVNNTSSINIHSLKINSINKIQQVFKNKMRTENQDINTSKIKHYTRQEDDDEVNIHVDESFFKKKLEKNDEKEVILNTTNSFHDSIIDLKNIESKSNNFIITNMNQSMKNKNLDKDHDFLTGKSSNSLKSQTKIINQKKSFSKYTNDNFTIDSDEFVDGKINKIVS